MAVGIVIVSHSDLLARGVAELAGQMAEGVTLVAAGGADDGSIGTSFDRVLAAIAEADAGDGVLVLADLGSAELTTEQAFEFLEAEQAERVLLAQAPIAEGTIAAAATAGAGAALAEVLAAAEAAGGGAAGDAGEAVLAEPDLRERVVLPNPLGLHARPASHVVAALRELDAEVHIVRTDTGAGASARSVLDVVGLGATGGVEVEIAGQGPDAVAAVERLAAMAREGFGEAGGEAPTEEDAPAPLGGAVDEPPPAGATLAGRGVVGGTVIGPLAELRRAVPPVPEGTDHDPEVEAEVLATAREAACAELEQLAAGAEGAIFAMHLALLDDPALSREVEEALAGGLAAAAAWLRGVTAHEELLAGMADAAFAARALDVRDVGDRVLRHLLGSEATAVATPPAGAVVAASDLTPSDVTQFADAQVAGLATAAGSQTSHAAILARNLGIPLVMRLGPSLLAVAKGTEVILDGDAGELVVAPHPERREAARAAIADAEAAAEAARELAAAPGQLADGTRVIVAANASSPAEARRAVAEGAEGIGLLRTEFLYLERTELPSEDEQVAELSAICEAMEGRPVIVRTLDAGGDKPAPALDLDPVRHGFLGQRGLRLSLARPEVFVPQLRAILRLAAAHEIGVMFPMVTDVGEVRRAKAALDEAAAALEAEGVPYGRPVEVGVMVEVPAAAAAPQDLVAEVDFCSVGSNDLIAYTMAADRTLEEVAEYYRPDHPAIDQLIAWLCDAAADAGCWVGVCGEMAADPDHAARLVGLGVRELSMASGAIPAVKARLRETSP